MYPLYSGGGAMYPQYSGGGAMYPLYSGGGAIAKIRITYHHSTHTITITSVERGTYPTFKRDMCTYGNKTLVHH